MSNSVSMRVVWGLLCLTATASAFAPVAHKAQPQRASSSKLFSSTANLAPTTSPLDPIINQLPWNARRNKEREGRRIRREVAQLHRDLGIPEDAPYEEVAAAADRAIVAAGRDVKKRLVVERSKDKILQLRLNERLAGLTSVNMEARSQTTHEKDGPAEVKKSKEVEKVGPPSWRDNLIVKPDAEWQKRQLGVWGTISVTGILLPPLIGKMLMIQLLVVIGQLIWRGVPKDDMGGGMNLFGASDGGGSHKKVAWLLGAGIFFGAKLFVFSMMPQVMRGYRWTEIVSFCAENVIFLVANLFLQPYKN